jgi:RNA polymerase sigma-70 factor (ECF subfamily)
METLQRGSKPVADEQALIAALKRRDPAALAIVFDRYADKLYRLAAGLLNDEQQADGVVQNTFLALIEHVDSFEGRASIGTWLYRVAYNEAMSRLRRARPHVDWETVDDADADDVMPVCLVNWDSVPEVVTSSHEALEQMQQAVASLSPALRAVFLLRDVEELSTRETAESLNISQATVKVRLHRARLALREQLAIYFEERVAE